MAARLDWVDEADELDLHWSPDDDGSPETTQACQHAMINRSPRRYDAIQSAMERARIHRQQRRTRRDHYKLARCRANIQLLLDENRRVQAQLSAIRRDMNRAPPCQEYAYYIFNKLENLVDENCMTMQNTLSYIDN